MPTPVAFLDDDPTGAQAVADVPVALAWSHGEVGHALRPGDRAIHVLTNTRAYAPEEARARTVAAALAVRAAAPTAPIVLRGDSTLRGHLWEEYDGLCEAVYGRDRPPLLLVPALPAAGRVTRSGEHFLLRDDAAVPIGETEYARDAYFGYRSSRLDDWAEERSGGRFAAASAAVARPDEIAAAVATAAARGGLCVVAADAHTTDDIARIAAGVRDAWSRGVPFVVRCSPALAAELGGTAATGLADPPPAGPTLVICGSFVETTTGQLRELDARHPGRTVLVPARSLGADASARAAIEVAAADASRLLDDSGLAIVATSREREAVLADPAEQLRAAARLAGVIGLLEHRPAVVVAKGGITSALTATSGLGARTARVIGPVLTGVARWHLDTPTGTAEYVVVPGNVGGPTLLADLADLLLRERAAPC